MKHISKAAHRRTTANLSSLLIGLPLVLAQFFTAKAYSQDTLKTYCNPINIDYGYSPIPAAIEQAKHRATADPLVVAFKGKFFLFSTNQHGYWWSSNMANWNFISRKFLLPRHKVYDDLCAPAAFVLGDSLLLIGSSNNPDFPLWISTNPTTDDWHIAIDSFPLAAWDPAFFADDDGRVYLYFGSSNLYPIYGCEINRATLRPKATPKPLISLNDSIHGWERFGEHNDNTFLSPFIEGAWMNSITDSTTFSMRRPEPNLADMLMAFTLEIILLGHSTTRSLIPLAIVPVVLPAAPGMGQLFAITTGNGGISQLLPLE